MENEKALKISTEFEGTGSHGILTGCLNIEVLPVLMFNLMVSVSLKMLHLESPGKFSEVREKSGKIRKNQSQTKWPPHDTMSVSLGCFK